MSFQEEVLDILKMVKSTKNLENVTDIVDGGYIDSFELMLLISTLSDKFAIEISVDDISPENFNSADAIAKMVKKIKNSRGRAKNET